MLNKIKLVTEIEKKALDLFYTQEHFCPMVYEQWLLLNKEMMFLEKVRNFKGSIWPIPLWQDELDKVIAVPDACNIYHIISVDGSQIYPDRHIKGRCFLINIGLVNFCYQDTVSSVAFESVPFVYPYKDEQLYSVEIINGIRHGHELTYGFEKAKDVLRSSSNGLLLFDGSFIFWHLDLQKGLRERFLDEYLGCLNMSYVHKIPSAAYISSPKSKELISILRLFLCNFDVQNTSLYESIDGMVDSLLVCLYLPIGYRTTIFKNTSPISCAYPDHLKPHFFYINVGKEVARVEFPAWMAEDIGLINKVASYIKDQAQKGDGYPVVLAEAHEQAVIKAVDRDFFYTYLERFTQKNYGQYKSSPYSQKLMHKKVMRV
ncbi:DNA double-strand break repair nuclease NurA [Candidatus Dependentiae bacterium]|nr:MAG: DNA double-strand break repair nuclease NurA [Candidatus Dependentiae bacterium]